MTEKTLRRSLRHRSIVTGMDRLAKALGTEWAIVNATGELIAGHEIARMESRTPIPLSDPPQGWLAAPAQREALVAALCGFLELEHERKVLAAEALDKYREVNLLFHIHEVIGTTLDYKQIARHLVEEATKLVANSHGVLLTVEDKTDDLVMVCGNIQRHRERLHAKQGIAGACLANKQADIVERVASSPHFMGETDFVSLMVAPVRTADLDLGVLVVGSDHPAAFNANDLKLLITLAAHGAIILENVRLYDELRELFHSTVFALAETIEKRDPYTGGHTQRVMDYALITAEALGMLGKDFEDLRLSAVLHDVGKIAVRDAVLLKEAPLDRMEFDLMKRHTEHGADILNGSRHLRAIVDGVRFHHERFDGKGYNYGLSGEDIPLVARIIAVADAFDAMTTDRPYRKGMSFAIAAAELRKSCGTQFDPAVVDAFLGRLAACQPDRFN